MVFPKNSDAVHPLLLEVLVALKKQWIIYHKWFVFKLAFFHTPISNKLAFIVPEQSFPLYPSLHLQIPDLTSHRPFPLQAPGHDLPKSIVLF